MDWTECKDVNEYEAELLRAKKLDVTKESGNIKSIEFKDKIGNKILRIVSAPYGEFVKVFVPKSEEE